MTALVRFFFTTTGFWLFRIALARRRAAWRKKKILEQQKCKRLTPFKKQSRKLN